MCVLFINGQYVFAITKRENECFNCIGFGECKSVISVRDITTSANNLLLSHFILETKDTFLKGDIIMRTNIKRKSCSRK